MKKMYAGIIWAALVLAAMGIVPIVSAAGLNASEDNDINASSELETLPVFTDPSAEQAYLETYESPCEKIIKIMKVKNYSSSQISKELKRNGYGWFPGTGACWKGTAPTPEEQKIINIIRGPGYNPFPESSGDKVNTILSPKPGTGRKGAAQNPENKNTFFRINLVVTSWHNGVRQNLINS